ncbi:hypothetical protein FK85_05470 [Halorubrum saccharovorum]|uniref:Uncharacterized protein n=1 Tax=Halorubrum saccharovorum TaxID=2248 RepID=A0A081EUT7_9EURY|nr:hypothetical protein [Halorubrum saccharovorum]KDS91175.1 hypothetical protein FK85_05470 [Halorubrum saccharovorum]
MSDQTPRAEKRTDTDAAQIEDLRELAVDDQVLVGDRTRPLDVVEMGVRVIGDERIDAEIEVPMAKLEGDWQGAQTIVLTHRIDRTPVRRPDGSYRQRLAELDAIVDMDLGREQAVRRTHATEQVDQNDERCEEVRA